MRDYVREAVLGCIGQAVTDGVRSGCHFASLTTRMAEDMAAVGYDPDGIHIDGLNTTLPGWFRPAKKWSIAAYEHSALIAGVKIRCVSRDFGMSTDALAEEALGSASDVDYATHNHLLEPNDLPPNFGYVLLIRKTDESSKVSKVAARSRYAFDSEFDETSYIDRFTVLGKRLLRERIYQAVWVAVVDLESRTVEEPDPLMTYDKFVAHLKGWIDVVRA